MRVSNSIIALLASLAAAAGLTLACVDVAYPDKAFRCDPSGPAPNCPSGFFCCSDDPSSLSVNDGKISSPSALPNFSDNNEDGESWAAPLFAGDNNKFSHSGMCVKPNSDPISIEGTEAGGCPIPCNPRWKNEQIAKVCGDAKAACCQTVQLHEKDCVAYGSKKCRRPATGDDVFASVQLTNWAGDAHVTHQDPGGQECSERYEKNSDSWRACIRRLTVADQRGFCVAPIDNGSGPERPQCPLAKGDYTDACEAMNATIDGCV